jgi:hypothetical protein
MWFCTVSEFDTHNTKTYKGTTDTFYIARAITQAGAGAEPQEGEEKKPSQR